MAKLGSRKPNVIPVAARGHRVNLARSSSSALRLGSGEAAESGERSLLNDFIPEIGNCCGEAAVRHHVRIPQEFQAKPEREGLAERLLLKDTGPDYLSGH